MTMTPDQTASLAVATMNVWDGDEQTLADMATLAAEHPELAPEEVACRWREQRYRQQMEAYAVAVAENR
jgi:hypothetical protein